MGGDVSSFVGVARVVDVAVGIDADPEEDADEGGGAINGSGCDDVFIGTFIFATLAKFIFVVDSSDVFGIGFVVSFGFVRTSASDVVNIFDANGLYSPVDVGIDGAGTSNEAIGWILVR